MVSRSPFASVRALLLCGVAMLPTAPARAQTVPTGGNVIAGGVTIASPSASSTIVTQTNQRAIVQWNSFGIGPGGRVDFVQPDSKAAILNRVTGNSATTIAGELNANGQVYVVNPNGLQITSTGVVRAGGFVGSSIDIDNDDFLAGRTRFGGMGGLVVNQGRIEANGGFVALLGSRVVNEGTITADLGRVALGSGSALTLDLDGDGFLSVALPADAVDAEGKPLVWNSGSISATGGMVQLKAATAAHALHEAVNMSGGIRATSVSGRDGRIVFEAGPGGRATVSGTLDVSGEAQGGRIDVSGAEVALTGAQLLATGSDRGGLVRIGGAYRGGASDSNLVRQNAFVERYGRLDPLPAAQVARIDAGSNIDVSATSGAGGSAVVWSQSSTSMLGAIKATGALRGGAVEISSANRFQNVALGRVKLGAGGTLLLDPKYISIDNVPPGDDPSSGQGYSDNAGSDTYLYSGDIATLLDAGTDVTLQANTDISWYNGLTAAPAGTPATLSLSAGRDVYLAGTFDLGGTHLTIVGNDTAAHGVDAGNRDGGAQGIQVDDASITNAGDVRITLETGTGEDGIDLVTGHIGAQSVTLENKSPSDYARILMRGGFTSPGAITLTGNLQLSGATGGGGEGEGEEGGGGGGGSGFVLNGASVTWTNESTARIKGGGKVQFIENGVVTRWGQLIIANQDANRLALGSDGSTTPAYQKTYGDDDPAPVPLHLVAGDFNADNGDTPYNILQDGSVVLTGPGSGAAVGDYNVTVSADQNNFAFTSGVRGYFIDLRPVTETLKVNPASLSVTLTPTVNDGSYTYGSPDAIVQISGIVGNDQVLPTASLTGLVGSETMARFSAGNFGFRDNLDAGSYVYTLTGITGTAASNYTLDLSGTISANLDIAKRPVGFFGSNGGHIYGDTPQAISVTLFGALIGDDVAGIAQFYNGAGAQTLGSNTHAGTYGVTLNGFTGAQANNYTVNPGDTLDGTYIVTRRPVTYATAAASSTYGTLATLGAVTLTNTISGDDIQGIADIAGLDYRTPVGSYAQTVSLGGAAVDDYVIASSGNTNASLTIGAKTLGFTLTGNATQQYLSTTELIALTGVVDGDDVTADAGLLVVESTNPYAFGLSSHTNVGTHNYSFTGLLGTRAGNYVIDLTGASGSLTVTAKPIGYNAGGTINTIYGSVPPSLGTPTLIGIDGGDDVHATNVLLSGSSPITATDRTAAGSYSYKPLTLTGTAAGNYVIDTSGNTDGVYIVAQKALTFTVPTLSTPYGTAANYATLTGILSGDTVTPITTLQASGGSAFTQTLRAGVGTYSGTVLSITGADVANYTLAGSGNTNGILTITPRPVTWSVAAANSTYGTLATLGNASLSNVLGGDDLAGTVTVAGLTDRSNVGSYNQLVTALTGADAANYALAGSGNTIGTLTIGAKALTANLLGPTYVYGSPTAAATLSGILSGDTVGPVATLGGTAGIQLGVNGLGYGFATRTAVASSGSYSVTGLYGTSASNYSLIPGSGTATLTITPKPLDYTLSANSQTYGTVASTAVTLTGAIAPDDVYATVTVTGSSGTVSLLPTTPVGNYTASIAGGLGGADAGNYMLANGGGPTSVALNITAKTLSYAIANSTATYGTLATGGAVTLTGVVGSDDVLGVSAFSQGGTPVTLAAKTSAGTYVQGLGGLGGTAAGNYVLASSGNTNGLLTISPKTISYAIANATGTYGTLATAGAVSFTGVLGGDTVTGSVTVKQGGSPVTLTDRSDAGTYLETFGTLGGASASNYVLAGSGNSDGQLVISPLTLSASIINPSYTYGSPTAVLSLAGVLSGDSVTPVATLGSTTGIALGTTGSGFGFAASTPVSASGAFSITGLAGAASANYALGSGLSGTVTITPKPLGFAINAPNTSYGTLATPGVDLTGVLFSDQVHALFGVSGSGGPVTLAAKTPVGNYSVNVTGLAGPQSGNYSLGSGAASLGFSITPKPLTYALGDDNYTYGDLASLSGPSFSGVLSGDDVQAGVSLANNVQIEERLDAGVYAKQIGALTGASAANYQLTDVGSTIGNLNVHRRAVTGSYLYPYPALAQQVYGSTTPIVTFNGLLAGDDVAPTARPLSTALRLVNTGGNNWGFGPRDLNVLACCSNSIYTTITEGLTGADAGNYNFVRPAGFFQIQAVPRPVTYTTYNLSSTYGDISGTAVQLNGVFADENVSLVVTDNYLGDVTLERIGNTNEYRFGAMTSAAQHGFRPIALTSPNNNQAARNYVLDQATSFSFGSLNIAPKQLNYTITLKGASTGVYGDIFSPQVTTSLTGLLPGTSASLAMSAPTFDSSHNLSSSSRVNVGTYQWKGTGTSNPNYTLAASGNTDATLTVTPRILTGSSTTISDVYGGTVQPYFAVTSNSLLPIPGDQVSFAAAIDVGGTVQYRAERTPAGVYTIAIQPSGLDAGNYAVALNGATMTITPRQVIVANNLSTIATYGSIRIPVPDIPIVTPTSGILPGDDVGYQVLANGNAIDSHTPVGFYDLTMNLTGAAASNYRVFSNFDHSNRVGQMRVDPRLISWVPFSNIDVTYGETHDGLVTYTNIVPGDEDRLVLTYKLHPGYDPDKYNVAESTRFDAGIYSIIQDRLSGAAAGNYILPNFPLVGKLTIVPRPLTYVLSDSATIYGTPATFTGALSNIIAGDSVSFGTSLFDPGNHLVAENAQTNAGIYTRRVTSLSDSNYSIATSGNDEGVTTITPKTLTMTRTSTVSDVYGGVTALATLNGVLFNDDVGFNARLNNGPAERLVTAGDSWTFGFNKVNAGTNTYLLTGLTGTRSANYSLKLVQPAGTLTITPKPLLYGVADATGRYGGYFDCENASACNPFRPGFQPGAVTLLGTRAGDDISAVERLVDFTGQTIDYNNFLKPGNYFEVATALKGADAGNYTIATSGNRPGILTIKPGWVSYTTKSVVIIGNSAPLGNLGEIGGLYFGPNGGGPALTAVTALTDFRGTLVDPTKLTGTDYQIRVIALLGAGAENYAVLPGGPNGYNDVGRLTFLPGDLGLAFVPPPPTYSAPPPPTTEGNALVDSVGVAGGLIGKSTSVFANPFATGTGVNTGTGGTATANNTGAGAGGAASGNSSQTTTVGDVDLGAQEFATVAALASAGVTGVRVEFNQSGGVNVSLTSGPGEVKVGVSETVQGEFRFGVTGASMDVGATAGAYIQGGASGSLGGGATGNVDVTTGGLLFATSETKFVYKDGKITTEVSNKTGAAYTVGVNAGVGGAAGSVDVGATLYSPGSFGEQFAVGGGYNDGTLSVDVELGLQLGLFGFDLNFSFSVDLGSVGETLGHVFGCAFGGNCTTTRPAPRTDYWNLADEYDRVTHAPELYAMMKAHPELMGREIYGGGQRKFSPGAQSWYRAFDALTGYVNNLKSTQESVANEVAAYQRAAANNAPNVDYGRLANDVRNAQNYQALAVNAASQLGFVIGMDNGTLKLYAKP